MEVELCTDGATIQSGLGGNYLRQSIVSQLQKEGGYSGMTTLGGLFPEKRFVAGTPITVKTVNLATGQTEQTMIGVAYVAAETSDTVCLGVGLHSGYGAAQRMYVLRGYVPDGSGVWYEGRVWDQYAPCVNDDELNLFLSKKLF